MLRSYSKIRHIQESNMILENRLLVENVVINGATFVVNADGTVSVTVGKKTSKTRFSYYVNINVKSISKTSDGGCAVTARNGRTETLSKKDVNDVINFVEGSEKKGTVSTVDMEKV